MLLAFSFKGRTKTRHTRTVPLKQPGMREHSRLVCWTRTGNNIRLENLLRPGLHLSNSPVARDLRAKVLHLAYMRVRGTRDSVIQCKEEALMPLSFLYKHVRKRCRAGQPHRPETSIENDLSQSPLPFARHRTTRGTPITETLTAHRLATWNANHQRASPRMRRARHMSLRVIVTPPAWMAHRLISSNSPVR